MSKQVLSEFKKSLGLGFLSSSPSKPTNPNPNPPPPPAPLQKEKPNLADSRRFNRSRDQPTQRQRESQTSIYIEKKKITTPTKPHEHNLHRSFALFLHKFTQAKLIDSFHKIKLHSITSSTRRIEKGLSSLHNYFVKKSGGLLKASFWFWNFQNTNVGNKELLRLIQKNEGGEKSVQLVVGKEKMRENIQFAFMKLKRAGLLTGKQDTARAKPLLLALQRQTKTLGRIFFQKLNYNPNSKVSLKAKVFTNIFTKTLKERLSSAFTFIRFNNKVLTEEEKKPKRSGSLSKVSKPQKQSFSSRKPQSQTLLESQIVQQKKIQNELQERIESFLENNNLEEQQALKFEYIESAANLEKQLLLAKQAIKKQHQLNQQQQNDQDIIRAAPNDREFYQKIKTLYLDLKNLQPQTVNKTTFIKQNKIKFQPLFEHTDYLLETNMRLKNHVSKLEEVFLPVENIKTVPKVNREIQMLKDELSKENQKLRRSVAKYVTAAYDTEWLFVEAKKLEEELNKRLVDSHQ